MSASHPAGCPCLACERPSLAALDAIHAPAAPLRPSATPTVVPPPSARCAGCRRVLLLTGDGATIPCEYCAPREGDPVAHALALGEQMTAAHGVYEHLRSAFDAAVAALTPDENLELLRRQAARLLATEEVPRG